MIYYIVSICMWALLVLLAMNAKRSIQMCVGTMILAGAVYALAQLLQI